MINSISSRRVQRVRRLRSENILKKKQKVSKNRLKVLASYVRLLKLGLGSWNVTGICLILKLLDIHCDVNWYFVDFNVQYLNIDKIQKKKMRIFLRVSLRLANFPGTRKGRKKTLDLSKVWCWFYVSEMEY